MAGPGLVLVVMLILIFVPVSALLWGRKEPPPVLSSVREPGTQRPRLDRGGDGRTPSA